LVSKYLSAASSGSPFHRRPIPNRICSTGQGRHRPRESVAWLCFFTLRSANPHFSFPRGPDSFHCGNLLSFPGLDSQGHRQLNGQTQLYRAITKDQRRKRDSAFDSAPPHCLETALLPVSTSSVPEPLVPSTKRSSTLYGPHSSCTLPRPSGNSIGVKFVVPGSSSEFRNQPPPVHTPLTTHHSLLTTHYSPHTPTLLTRTSSRPC
jgi:hypothetical protein